MDIFLSHLKPFVRVLEARRVEGDDDIAGIIERNKILVPTFLLDAVHYDFLRLQGYRRDRFRGADYEGGFNGLSDREEEQFTHAAIRQLPSVVAGEGYSLHVVYPLCMILWIRHRDRCTLGEAEHTFHTSAPMTHEEQQRELAVWRRHAEEDRRRAYKCIADELEHLYSEIAEKDTDDVTVLNYGDDVFRELIEEQDLRHYTEAKQYNDGWMSEETAKRIFERADFHQRRRLYDLLPLL